MSGSGWVKDDFRIGFFPPVLPWSAQTGGAGGSLSDLQGRAVGI